MKCNGGWIPRLELNCRSVMLREDMAHFLDTYQEDDDYYNFVKDAYKEADMLLIKAHEFEWLDRIFCQWITEVVIVKMGDNES